MMRALFVSLFLLVALVVGWHFLFPIADGMVSITTGIWSFVVATVVIYCVAILLLFIFTGIGIFVLGIFATVWFAIAIALFPIAFPIFIPLLITVLFISYVRRRQLKKKAV